MKKLLLFFVSLLMLCGCQPQGSEIKKDVQGSAEVHFIDVGQADCSLILCDGDAVLIDAGNNDDSETVINYLLSQGVDSLKYAVGTHAHEDHIGALDEVIDYFDIENLILSPTEGTTKTYQNVIDSAETCNLEVQHLKPRTTFSLGEGTFTVLGPVEDYSNLNDSSVVLMFEYGNTSFLFTGDAEMQAEHDILDAGLVSDIDVLKVGHHGSSTSSSYVFLRETMPEYAIISAGKNNDYGHPHEEVMSRLYDAGAEVWRTDTQGTVLASTDGSAVTISSQEDVEPTAGREPSPETEITYIGNINSKKFHLETCSGLPKEENRVYFSSREKAVESGYTACQSCNP